MKALIMAGGRGSRMGDLTDRFPKPMLPVGGRPLLEHTVGHLRRQGITDITISVHYLAERIKEHFGNEVRYLEGPEPLGSGGALRLLEKPEEPLLVINGDLLTNLDFQRMLAFHDNQAADCTMAITNFSATLPYGVVVSDGIRVADIAEKPTVRVPVNAGIYIFDPRMWLWLPKEKREFGMAEFVVHLANLGEKVCGYPMPEETLWADVGTPASYAIAGDMWAKSQTE